MEAMDIEYFMNASSETQMELVNMMLQMETLAELTEQAPSSEFSTPSPPSSYYGSPTDPASPAMPPVGPQPSAPFNNCAPLQEPLMFPSPTPTPTSELAVGGSSFSRRPSSVAAMREMIFRIAAMQPVRIDREAVKPPKRRNVRTSKDPQSVAARLRRERISERIRILQRMVPGGTKMDTASMLDEAVHYVKFLQTQVQSMEQAAAGQGMGFAGVSAYPVCTSGCMAGTGGYSFYQDTHQLQDQGAFTNYSTDSWN